MNTKDIINEALVKLKLNEPLKAIELINNKTSIDQDNPDLLLIKGVSYMRLDKLDDALETIEYFQQEMTKAQLRENELEAGILSLQELTKQIKDNNLIGVKKQSEPFNDSVLIQRTNLTTSSIGTENQETQTMSMDISVGKDI